MNLVETAMEYLGASEYAGTHKPIIDIYNTIRPLPRGYKMRYSDAWCMAFVSACAWKCGPLKRFPYECSCTKAIELLNENDLWEENDAYVPSPNDLIFYHWGQDNEEDCTAEPNHVGIVVSVTGDIIKLIEGNYSNMVRIREITVNHCYIRGYGITSELMLHTSPDMTAIAYQVIAGKWGNMPERVELLEAAGYDYPTVQAIVNGIYEYENPVSNALLKDIAISVIRGEWGNNPERKTALLEAGYDYQAVQDVVNSILEREV